MEYEYDKLTEEQKSIADYFHEQAWDQGFDEGYEAGEVEGHDIGYRSGKDEGMKFERNRVYHVCTMQMRWAEQADKARDYLMWKNVRDFLNPDNFQPMSEEEFDRMMEEF